MPLLNFVFSVLAHHDDAEPYDSHACMNGFAAYNTLVGETLRW